MNNKNRVISNLRDQGFHWMRRAYDTHQLNRISEVCGDISARLSVDSFTEFADGDLRLDIDNVYPGAIPVRAVLFSKNTKKTWSLPWHQDRVIAVNEKHNCPGFDLWTRKNNIWHCEPPVQYLERMIFAQIYLDDVRDDQGPTELAISSHKFGKIAESRTSEIIEACKTHICSASKGDVLLANALILHRSNRTLGNRSRRILRIDLANFKLPHPLEWLNQPPVQTI